MNDLTAPVGGRSNRGPARMEVVPHRIVRQAIRSGRVRLRCAERDGDESGAQAARYLLTSFLYDATARACRLRA